MLPLFEFSIPSTQIYVTNNLAWYYHIFLFNISFWYLYSNIYQGQIINQVNV